MSQSEAHGKKGGKERRSAERRGEISRAGTIEWLLGALSAVVVAAMIGFLLYQALAVGRPAPEFETTVRNIELRGGAYHVVFRALNRGQETVAGVTVVGRLVDGERRLESSTVTLDYLPAQSERQGALLFRNDPNEHRLELEIQGYREP